MGRSSRRKPDRHRPELRSTSMWRVDQVFLTHRGARIQVTVSLVNDQSGLRNLSVVAPTGDPIDAMVHAARYVAGQGNVSGAWNARVRWTKHQAASEQENLVRDTDLEDAFLDAFEDTLAEVRDQQR